MKLKIIGCCLLIVLLAGSAVEAYSKINANSQIIRLHIISNNMSPESKQIKLMVRDKIAEWLYSQEINQLAPSEARIYLAMRLSKIKEITRNVLCSRGVNQQISISFGETNLPAKMYRDKGFFLPAGKYLTINVIIGKGKGQNWWCIAYPNQCLTGNTVVKVNDSDKLELKSKFIEWWKENRKKYFDIYQDSLMF